MVDWNKASSAANVGMFAIAALGLAFFVWDRSKGVAMAGWGIPVLIVSALLLSAGLHVFAAYISRGKEDGSSATTKHQPETICPYEWSHEIIDLQRREIRSWIVNERCSFDDADLFRARPYLQFRFSLYNASIFQVALTKLSGTIEYANISLAGEPKWVGSPPLILPGCRNDGVVRFTFEDPQDASGLLNVNSGFDFTKLLAAVETTPETRATDYSFVSHTVSGFEGIRKKYPNLKIEVKQARLTPHYNLDEKPHDAITGSLVTLKIEFRNPRSLQIRVQDFKLDTFPHVERITSASSGLIYGKVWIESGKPENRDRLTPNLKDDLPIAADREEPIEGWLQFYLSKVTPGQLNGQAVNLMIVDDARVEHVIGTPVLNVTYPDLHAGSL